MGCLQQLHLKNMESSNSSNPFQTAFSLKDEVALITGGATGLGFGIAHCMVAAGARVVVVGRRQSELDRAVAKLGRNAIGLSHDVTNFAGANDFLKQVECEVGAPVSILVNNAGVHLKKPAASVSVEEFQTVLNTHVLGAHALTAAALPGMLDRGHGSLLFTASMASLFGIPLVLPYSAAKSAYVGMVRTLAAEVSGQGVRVNAIAPGWIDSEMMRKALAGDPTRSEKILSRTPMKSFGEACDVGWAAVYLCSPAAKFITGVVLPVDGGASIGF
jgi:gluconate 5-dehydrogenase